MHPPRCPRRFQLADAAILVAATALGLWAIRGFLPGLVTTPRVLEDGRWVARWWDPVILLNRAVVLEVVLMAWSLGWLALQLRQPRPRLRRLARRPGFVATFGAAVVLLLCGPLTAASLASGSRSANLPGESWVLFETWSALVSSQIGAAVAAGWAILALGRASWARSGWLDRVGQVV